jgi:hypothetical protein
MMRRLVCRVLVACGLVLVLQPSKAEAKGFMMVTYGDSVFHVARVPEDQKTFLRQVFKQDAAVGYHYDYFGVFWLDFWTWDGQWCLYNGNRYWPLSAQQAALILKTKPDDLRKPFLYTFPLGLTIVGVLFGGLVLIAKFVKTDDDRTVAKLQSDPRYAQAIQIFLATLPSDEADPVRRREKVLAALQSAVEYLTTQGVPREEAEKNLGELLKGPTQPATIEGPVPSTNSLLR